MVSLVGREEMNISQLLNHTESASSDCSAVLSGTGLMGKGTAVLQPALMMCVNFLVFDTIPILAVWPVLVSYQHSVVGILVGVTDYIFA